MVGEAWLLSRVYSIDPRLALVHNVARLLVGGDPAHGWPHILRVSALAEAIVKAEGLDPDWLVLYASILLHDAGRSVEGEGHHAVKGAKLARELVEALWDRERALMVEHAIHSHSYSLGVKARTLEAMILADADRLDALGAIGIARVFHTGCTMKRGFEDSVRHLQDKILKLAGTMHFNWARKEAARRLERVKAFMEWWLDEGQPGQASEN